MLNGHILEIRSRTWHRDRSLRLSQGDPAVLTQPAHTVLFLCTGNSCRSILAEALLNELGNGEFQAYSAGSKPAGFVHPHALACLNHNRIPVFQPHSKTWDDFSDMPLDLVVTVCDNAAGEACPLFSGSPAKVHWGLPDPALATGSDAEIAEVFQTVFESLQNHIKAFVDEVASSDQPDLAEIAKNIGTPEVPELNLGPAS